MMKQFLTLTCLALLMLVGTAHAETTTFEQKVTLAQPFGIESVANAVLGTLYITNAAETVTIDASTIVAVTGDDSGVAVAAVVHTAGNISRGGAPVALSATQKVAIVSILANQGNVDIAVAMVGTATLDIPFSLAPTPINVTGITSNTASFNGTTIAATEWATLAIGPIFEIPANAEIGGYSGTVTIDITAL